MKYLLSLLACFIPFTIDVFGQNDPEAVKILDRFSTIALSAPSISMKFNLTTVDQVEGTKNTDTGAIILSKDKYRLDLPENIIWFDGVTSWNYLTAEKEVTITKPGKDDDSFQSHPSAVFSIYRKDYKSRLINRTSDAYIIDLYPEDINSDHIRIRLTIGNPSFDLKTLEYKYKNGLTVTLDVTEYNLRQKPVDSEFTFPSDRYSGIEIVDMR